IDTYRGQARFIDRARLEVAGEPLLFRHALLACGAEPVQLGIPGERHLVTNEGFLTLERLPQRIVLVGGGYIAAEFSRIAARVGSHVVVLQRGERMLKSFDADLVGWLMEKFEAQGIEVHTGTRVDAIDATPTGYTVNASSAAGRAEFDAELVVHAAGRAPALAPLDLDAGGIEVEHGRLKLNEYLQSVSNPAVYAAGDVAQVGPPLTPVSSHDAKVVAANLLKGNHRKPDYTGVPSVAFTIPPIAMVGLSEDQARRQGVKFRIQSEKASDWFTARQAAEPIYGFKVLVDEESDQILGAHLVGPHADEVINLFALAIRHQLTSEDLKRTLFAYPTGASDIGYML
ncbi:MAG: dihydrolipoyl dehydrogenase family protein, partial [Gammaproteobacteria bacterium]